jgi:hypothetical protein
MCGRGTLGCHYLVAVPGLDRAAVDRAECHRVAGPLERRHQIRAGLSVTFRASQLASVRKHAVHFRRSLFQQGRWRHHVANQLGFLGHALQRQQAWRDD